MCGLPGDCRDIQETGLKHVFFRTPELSVNTKLTLRNATNKKNMSKKDSSPCMIEWERIQRESGCEIPIWVSARFAVRAAAT
jgi:hypothetical protein